MDDPLTLIQEQADTALAQVQKLAATDPIQGAVYGLGQSVRMMSVIVTELSSGLTPDERDVVGEAISAVEQIVSLVENVAQQ